MPVAGYEDKQDLTFFTNEEGQKLEDRFKRTLKDVKYFDILVGYFRTSGFYKLYKDFENNDSNYNLSFSDFKKLNDEYYIYLIYELFISYTLAFIIYFLIPLLIFKKDQTLMMKMFKLVGANKKTNLNLIFINYLIKFILLYLIFLFSLLIFIFLFYFSYLNMIFIGFINIFNISIFSFLLLLINMFLPILNKKHYSLINLGSNEIIKKSDEFINEINKE